MFNVQLAHDVISRVVIGIFAAPHFVIATNGTQNLVTDRAEHFDHEFLLVARPHCFRPDVAHARASAIVDEVAQQNTIGVFVLGQPLAKINPFVCHVFRGSEMNIPYRV